jgi:hypothetical protein
MIHGYRFAIIFLIACILHDLFYEVVTGFTFGYVAAVFYYIMRYNELRHFYVEDHEKGEDDEGLSS